MHGLTELVPLRTPIALTNCLLLTGFAQGLQYLCLGDAPSLQYRPTSPLAADAPLTRSMIRFQLPCPEMLRQENIFAWFVGPIIMGRIS